MDAIVVKNLVKQYKNGVTAINDLSLSVQAGEIFTLLGQNGAGKSTLINILTTFLKPSSGTVTAFGKDLSTEASLIRRDIACVAQKTSIDTYLSLTENMIFQSRIYKIPKKEAIERMNTLIQCFGLERYTRFPVASYSGGVKRRLDIALHMMSNPKILFLDEPTVGMDIQSRHAMWEMMKKIRTEFKTTVFLTTHYLEEADQLSDTICIMKEGKEIIQGTPAMLKNVLRRDMLEIRCSDEKAARENKQKIIELFKGKSVETRGESLVFPICDKQEDLYKASQFLINEKIAFSGIQILKPTLEDVFLQLTSEQEGML